MIGNNISNFIYHPEILQSWYFDSGNKRRTGFWFGPPGSNKPVWITCHKVMGIGTTGAVYLYSFRYCHEPEYAVTKYRVAAFCQLIIQSFNPVLYNKKIGKLWINDFSGFFCILIGDDTCRDRVPGNLLLKNSILQVKQVNLLFCNKIIQILGGLKVVQSQQFLYQGIPIWYLPVLQPAHEYLLSFSCSLVFFLVKSLLDLTFGLGCYHKL